MKEVVSNIDRIMLWLPTKCVLRDHPTECRFYLYLNGEQIATCYISYKLIREIDYSDLQKLITIRIKQHEEFLVEELG